MADSSLVLDCGGKPLDLTRCRVMGILNVTPDSFSDGGQFATLDRAIEQARRMAAEGADIIDVGGESTRPGAKTVSEQQELDRVIPVIEAISGELPIPVSVDTSKPAVMTAAVKAGAGMINDVLALRTPGALEAARDAGVPVCLMHMQGEPRTMQRAPRYDDVVSEVMSFLRDRVRACVDIGMPAGRIIVDPGFGFGKTLAHNLELLRCLGAFRELGRPLVVGISRKSMIGALLGDAPVDKRLHGSLAAAALAVREGARIIRVHDIRPSVDIVKVTESVMGRP